MLLGAFTASEDHQPLRAPVLHKAADLLALVLLAPGRRVLREAAAEALWPDARGEQSRKSIRQALWQIHRATDDGLTGDDRLVVSDGETVGINPGRSLWVDAAVFSQAVRRAQEPAPLDEAELARLAAAADLYRGPLHAGCYDEWCLAPRARLEDRCLTLLDRLSREAERQGALESAIGWAQRLLEIEPAHERSHRRLMRLYVHLGDRTRALRQLTECRTVLAQQLGIRPDALTEELGAAILADRLRVEGRDDEVVVRGVLPRRPLPGDQGPLQVDLLAALRTEISALRSSLETISESLGTGADPRTDGRAASQPH